MADGPRMTEHTRTVLKALLGRGTDAEHRAAALDIGVYGLELARQTELPNGTLFPVLERLVQHGWAERYWEKDESAEAEGRPRRRYYRITSKGAELAAHALDSQVPQTISAARAAVAPLRPRTTGGAR